MFRWLAWFKRPAPAPAQQPITREDVLRLQRAWGQGIVDIGKASLSGGNHRAVAVDLVDRLYAYSEGSVMFKPTKASKDQFRESKDQAISYFVGGDNPEDHGFALHPWSEVRFENQDIAIDSDSAMVMGNYHFTDARSSDEVKVEFTFGLKRARDGRLVITLHHSSLPYAAAH